MTDRNADDGDTDIRADRKRKAYIILQDLANRPDRARAVLAFVQQLHDKDKMAELIKAHADGYLEDEDIPLPLLYGYLDAKAPMSTPGLVDFFRIARIVNGAPILDPRDRLPDLPITIYRGSVDAAKHGISWSVKRNVAKGFAERCGGKVYRYKLTDIAAIFAAMSKIGEYEILVDPKYLTNVEEDVE